MKGHVTTADKVETEWRGHKWKRVGQAGHWTMPGGERHPEAAGERWSRPTGHKVAWDHSSSGCIGLTKRGVWVGGEVCR